MKYSEYQRLINPTLLVLSRVSFSLSFSFILRLFSGRCFALTSFLSRIRKEQNQTKKNSSFPLSGHKNDAVQRQWKHHPICPSVSFHRFSFPAGMEEKKPSFLIIYFHYLLFFNIIKHTVKWIIYSSQLWCRPSELGARPQAHCTSHT